MRGQLFSIDFLVAVSIFLIIIGFIVILNAIVPYSSTENLRAKAFSVSDFLITQYIGTENVLDCSKLYDLAFKDYTQIKNELSVSPYEVWIKFENVTSGLCPGLRPNLDIMLVIDRSGSMEQDNKLRDAKTASKSFVDKLNESYDQAGLISFSTNAGTPNQTLLNMTSSNKTTLKNKIDQLEASGWTNIGDAIGNASAELLSVRARTEKTIKIQVLLSDGQPNRPLPPPGYCLPGESSDNCNERYGTEHSLKKAKEACLNNLKIHSISLGDLPDGANRTLMQLIANLTGGKEYYAPTSSELQNIFNNISEEIKVISDYGKIATGSVTNLASVVRIVNLGGKKLKMTVSIYKFVGDLKCT